MAKSDSLYINISNDIRADILAQKYRPGDLLPSEHELMSRYSTSRATIRTSLGTLENEGLIYSLHGKGYFVSKPENNKYTLYFGLNNPQFKVKFNKIIIAYPDEHIKTMLGIKDNQTVAIIRRIIYNNTMPVACDEKYLPYEKGMPFIEDEIQYADFPELVAKKLSPFELRSSLEIGVELPRGEISRLLCVRMDEPLLVAYRLVQSYSGMTVGYGITYMRQNYGRLTAQSGYFENKTGW